MGYDTPHVFRIAIGVAVRVDGDRAAVAYGVDHPGFGVLTREYVRAAHGNRSNRMEVR